MKFYLVRHGKTQWNQERKFQGMKGDSPLLEESYQEIAKLGDYLSDIDFDKALASPSKRAQDTAKGILEKNKHKVNLETDERLYEWNLGSLEGRSIDEVSNEYPDQLHAFRNNPAEFDGNLFGAENVEQVTERFKNLLASILADPSLKEDSKVLLVGHGASLTSGIQSILGYNSSELRKHGILSNSSVTTLAGDSTKNIELIEWNKVVE